MVASAQPVWVQSPVQIKAVQTGLHSPLRIAVEPDGRTLVWLTYDGRLFRLPPPYAANTPSVIATADDHGLRGLVQGMTIGPDGTIYLVSNNVTGATTVGIVRRGRPSGSGFTWSTVMQTEPYPRSNTPFDHSMSAIVVSPDARFLYINSGSRTDHGEEQSNGGLFPGVREVPLTSAILRIPIDADNLLLRNDEAFLKAGGYLFADGVRNAFDLAFDAEGHLFGTENAGDRDDNEELNWLQEGRHYGFPWRIGTNDTPMRFPGYDPAQDKLLNPASTAFQSGGFHNDPVYPAPPAGVTFTEPIRNLGPDANLYRDPITGQIRDADGQPFATFTSHRSPLGLVFSPHRSLYNGATGCVLGWTGDESDLLRPFGDEGEDLLCFRLTPAGTSFEASVQRLVKGFVNPIDQVMTPGTNELFVIEFADPATLWQIGFGPIPATEAEVKGAKWQLVVSPEPVVAGQGRVSFTAPVSQHVRVDLYTLLGQRESTLFDALASGNEPRTLALPGTLAPGVHVLRIAGAQEVVTRPFVVR